MACSRRACCTHISRRTITTKLKDITERKKAEKALEEKVEELEKWYQLTVDREVKMTELKNRIQELESELKHKGDNPDVNVQMEESRRSGKTSSERE